MAGLLERFRAGRTAVKSEKLVDKLEERVFQGDLTIEYLSERLAELELALEDEGWIRFGQEGELDFSLSGIQTIIRLSRLMSIKNPLIKNGVKVQADYVFGQGVEIKAQDPRVDTVIQRFLESSANKKILTKHQARWERERDLQVEGNIFFALFSNLSTGDTTIRCLPTLEIQDVICNPDDGDEPWWYKRVWTERRYDARIQDYELIPRVAYYRDWEIPKQAGKVTQIGGKPVQPDVWVYHLKVGALRGMKFGVPETYASLDWARAYKDWLQNWASLEKALAKLAWRLTGKSKQLRKAKTKLGSTVGTDGEEDNPPPVTGSTALTPENMQLEAIPKTGAHVSADDGTQLRKMAAAGMGISDAIISSDPQQGTMATAKTLDRPTELGMRGRQMFWADVLRDVLRFVVSRTLRSPNGRLQEAPAEGEGPLDLTIDVVFPKILERDPRDGVRAVVDAATLSGRERAGSLPDALVTRMLLVALGHEDIDKVMKEFTPGAVAPEDKKEIESAVKEVRRELLKLIEEVKAA